MVLPCVALFRGAGAVEAAPSAQMPFWPPAKCSRKIEIEVAIARLVEYTVYSIHFGMLKSYLSEF